MASGHYFKVILVKVFDVFVFYLCLQLYLSISSFARSLVGEDKCRFCRTRPCCHQPAALAISHLCDTMSCIVVHGLCCHVDFIVILAGRL